MKLELNKIYKVKEGHEGRCESFKNRKGKYIKITGFTYDILGLGYTGIGYCSCCFTEDDLEPIEEEVEEPIDIKNIRVGVDIGNNIKSLEDLEVGDEVKEEYTVNMNISNNHSFYKIKLQGDIFDVKYNEDLKEITVYTSSTPPKDTVKEIELLEKVYTEYGFLIKADGTVLKINY